MATNPLVELAKEYKEEVEYVAAWGDTEYIFHIKQHISLAIRSAILSNVNQLYFDDDGYDPTFGDLALRMVIAQQYTGETFNDDVEVYEIVHKETAIWNHLPMEAKELYGSAHDKLEYEKKRRAKEADALKDAYDRIAELGESLSGIAKAMTEFLNKAQESFDGENIPMSELIDLFKTVNKKDEQKIAQAVLDYRAEKAKKKEAEKV